MRAVPGVVIVLALGAAGTLEAQDNFEIQVYPSATVEPRLTLLALHSNYTADGLPSTDDGTVSSHHALHETIAVTHGFNSWFELGASMLNSVQEGQGLDWVGNQIRPRFRAPEQWHWPLGVGLSAEFGYVRHPYAVDEWSFEIQPIVDKQWGWFYWAVNPGVEIALSGPGKGQGAIFTPNAKIAADLNRTVSLGVEYYASLGPLSGFDPAAEQKHAIYPAIDLFLGGDWELNAGVGFGLTAATDKTVLKVIVGRRFGGKAAVSR
jgi:hypothetical protein